MDDLVTLLALFSETRSKNQTIKAGMLKGRTRKSRQENMQLCYDNRKIWLNILCKGVDCKNLHLADLITSFQEGIIKSGDHEKLLQCLICNSDAVWKKWKSIVRVYSEDEDSSFQNKSKDVLQDELQDFLINCQKEAEETINWFKFGKMKNHKNDDFFRLFNNQMGYRLRGRRIKFVKEQFVSASSFIDTAREFNILSANEIGEINGLSSERKKAQRIVKILNEEILRDEKLYYRVKDNLSIKNTELDDFTKTLLLQKENSIPGSRKYKTIIRVLNKGLVLVIFRKSIIGLKDLPEINKDDNWIGLDPQISEASYNLFVILCLLEDGAFLKKSQAEVDAVMSFFRCLLIEYGQRYRLGEFVLECILDGRAKTARARQQKARFVDRIKQDLKDGDIDKNHFIFKNCHGRRYADLLCMDDGPAFIVNGIEKALKFKMIDLTKHQIGQLR